MLLSRSSSLGHSPAAGDRAPDLPEPVHAVLGQPHHQRHDLRRWQWCHLLPGTEPSSCCTGWVEEEEDMRVLLSSHGITGRVEEQDTWGLALMESDI